tara:strand:+ start:399 stop:3416 length:3018 start_codon:yes stop_codon:yes gene_type:complete
MKNYLMVFFTFLFTLQAFSQQLTGTVKVDGEPIPGVNIINIESGTGTLSDFDGNFSIDNLSEGDEIEFSYIGFQTQRVVFNGQTSLNISLEESSEKLEEVIVTGYGSVIAKNLSSSIVRVDGESVKNTALGSFEQALQGRAAGVQVITGSGMSGSGTKIRIRGANSATASSDPLYVVDGIIMEQGNYRSGNQSVGFMDTPTNILSSINPNDIQSMEVLKDAAATAIYGARGSNGVILITTKQGQAGATKIEATFDVGLSEATRRLDYVNAEEYLMLAQEAWYNAGQDPTKYWDNSGVLTAGNTKEKALTTDTDWQDVALKTGIAYRANISASGGSEKTKFFVSGNFLEEESIFVGNEYLKLNARTNLNHKVNDKLSVGTNINFTYVDNSPVPVQNGIGRAVNMLPIEPVFNPDGTYFNVTQNPRAWLDLYTTNIKNRTLTGSWYLRYQLSDALSFRTEFGLNSISVDQEQYMDRLLSTNDLALASESKNTINAWNWKNLLNYRKSFGDHSFDVLAGIESSKSKTHNIGMRGDGFASTSLKTPQDAATQSVSFNESAFTYLSIISRLNYNYKGKYLFSFTARRDGSSRFGRAKQWGTFPAGSLGYNISEEPFFEPLKGVFSYLKLKASYGITGNAEIGNYQNESRYNSVQYNGLNGISLSNIADDQLGWEESIQTNFAISAELFNGTIRADVDVYDKLTKDLLLPYPVSIVSGLTRVTTNLGEISNKGIEIVLGATLMEKNDITWDVEFQYAKNTNEVLSIGDNPEGINLPGFGTTSIYVGKPIGIQTLPIWSGVDPATGQDMYLEQSTGLSLTETQAAAQYGNLNNFFSQNNVAFGNPWPDFTGGFSTDFSYKNWSISALFSFAVGQDYLASGENINSKYFAASSAMTPLRHILGRWRSPGDVTNIAQVNLEPTLWSRTSEYVSDLDYLRMRDFTFTYSFNLPENSSIKGLDVYTKLTNFLTWTNAQPWMFDPENYVRGGNLNLMDKWRQVPQAKTVNIGVNLKF